MRTRLLAAVAAAVLATAGMAVPIVGPASPAVAHPVNPADFDQVELARGVAELGEPMSMAVLPDRSVLHTARNGVLRRTTAAGVTTVIGTLPVYGASSADGTQLIIWTCHGGANQRWTLP